MDAVCTRGTRCTAKLRERDLMSDKTDRTFVDCVLAGDALDTDVDAFVEMWHDSNEP